MASVFQLFRRTFAGLLFAAFLVPGPASAACELRVGWDQWPPYFTEDDGRFHGLEYDLLMATADMADCRLEFIRAPWARALKMLSDGSLDLLYGAGYSPERAEFARYSIPYRMERWVLMRRRTSERVSGPLSLKAWISRGGKAGHARVIGVFRGNVYGEQIDRILETADAPIRLIELDHNEQMVGMLMAGRIDGYLVEDGVARMQMRDSGYPLHMGIIEEQEADPLHYIFSHRVADEVIERFNEAIERQDAGVLSMDRVRP